MLLVRLCLLGVGGRGPYPAAHDSGKGDTRFFFFLFFFGDIFFSFSRTRGFPGGAYSAYYAVQRCTAGL